MDTILVGVDGSPESREALRWALEEARLHGARVQAVHVYHYEPSWRFHESAPFGPIGGAAPSHAGYTRECWEQDAAEAEERANALLARTLEDLGAAKGGVDIETLAIHDPRPARALLQLAAHADLLAVGSRGHGGFSGLLLGSCSQQCVQHGPCPVAIVRRTR